MNWRTTLTSPGSSCLCKNRVMAAQQALQRWCGTPSSSTQLSMVWNMRLKAIVLATSHLGRWNRIQLGRAWWHRVFLFTFSSCCFLADFAGVTTDGMLDMVVVGCCSAGRELYGRYRIILHSYQPGRQWLHQYQKKSLGVIMCYDSGQCSLWCSGCPLAVKRRCGRSIEFYGDSYNLAFDRNQNICDSQRNL